MSRPAQQPVVISVHVPKAAGTSMLRAYRLAYGAGRVRADYEDHLNPAPSKEAWEKRRPLTLPPMVRVVHGHFAVRKYDLLQIPAIRVTWLREPVDNLISVYYFFQQNRGKPRFQQASGAGRVLGRNYTLLQMAEDPVTRGSISRYFDGFDMSRMAFIGDHARRDEDMTRLSGILGVPLNAGIRERVTSPVYAAERAAVKADSALMARLRELLADEISFYARWAKP